MSQMYHPQYAPEYAATPLRVVPPSLPPPHQPYNIDMNVAPLEPHSSAPTPSPPDDVSIAEPDHSDAPTPLPVQTIFDGKIWSLEFVQQPIRARMCGFGDKDRRPITAPPCIRLVIKDAITKKEIDPITIDTSYFVATVDLWNWEATKEVNLVRSTAQAAPSPQISSVHQASFTYSTSHHPSAQTPRVWREGPAYSNQHQYSSPISAHQPGFPTSPYPMSSTANAYASTASPVHPAYQQPPYEDPRNGYQGPYGNGGQFTNGHRQSQSLASHSSQNGQPMASPYQTGPPMTSPYISHPNPPHRSQRNGSYESTQNGSVPSSSGGMYTRNLIGSLSASAFKLDDNRKKPGIWFILQDLSVRTEGWFRLKVNFVNVGEPATLDGSGRPGSSSQQAVRQTVTQTTAPVLASAFSKPFQVFSAKKFPGVIESTELSKAFAGQGIKIPIRKDGAPTTGKRKHTASVGSDDDEDGTQTPTSAKFRT